MSEVTRTRPRVLVTTPILHIHGLPELLREVGDLTVLEDPTADEVAALVPHYHAIFTNPNKSRVYLGPDVLSQASRLQVICTASTGTTHIDLPWVKERGIAVLSLKEERAVIGRISSTAEHSFALTLAALRHVAAAAASVRDGDWDYTRFIGRQLDCLTVGVVGYGRLGRFYARYARAFGSEVLVHDPYVDLLEEGLERVALHDLIDRSDVISLHVHVNDETRQMVNAAWFERMKATVLLVNTSRGEIVDEAGLIDFLRKHPEAMYAADVVSDETRSRETNSLLAFGRHAANVLITPHIGGMTSDAQSIAYVHAATQLRQYFIRTKGSLT